MATSLLDKGPPSIRGRPLSRVRAVGFAAGLVLAVVLVLSWRIPAEGGGLGADARFTVLPPGELKVQPYGNFLAARALQAGGATAMGEFELRNIGPRRLPVRLVALPSSRELDSLLRVRAVSDGHELADGELGELRRGSRPLELAPGETATVELGAWLPSAAEDHEGLAVDVTVELRTGR